MLHEFLTANSAEIIARTRAKVAARTMPVPTQDELKNGVPLFLKQLGDRLREATTDSSAIEKSAAHHGSELLNLGFTVSQVVHGYGDVCQAITQLALETDAPITVDEFNTFNRCQDDATAQAVTEYERQRDKSVAYKGMERQGMLAQEMGNRVAAALISFRVSLRTTVTSDRVVFDVEDECGGLPAGKIDELFQPFKQRGINRSGLGLGLTITRRGIEAMGGRMAVRNLPGQGCVFSIDLPRLPVA